MAMNVLKVRSSPYYQFQNTLYMTKATEAVKPFSSRLRRRKAIRFQTWLEDRGYTVCSNDAKSAST